MANIKFHDYLDGQLKDPVFRAEFKAECTKLEKEIASSQTRKQSVPQSAIDRIAHDNTTNN